MGAGVEEIPSTPVGYPSCYGTGVEEAGVEEGPHVQHRLHRLPRLHRQHRGIRRSAGLDVRLYAPLFSQHSNSDL